MNLPSLPPPLGDVQVPQFLAPSRFSELQKCPLRVLGGSHSWCLLPGPAALLGIMLHHVRDQLLRGRWGSAETPAEACDLVWTSVMASMDEWLAGSDRTSALAPLRQVVGRAKWNSRVRELRVWAGRLDSCGIGEPPAPLRVGDDGGSRAAGPGEATLEFGPEAWVVCPELRIRGRPDRVTAEGMTVEVSDYKSGIIVDRDGHLLRRHALQLGVYALAVEALAPGRPVRLQVDGRDHVEVPWDAEARDTTEEEWGKLLEELPAGQTIPARDLARPGRICRGCPLRPGCTAYLAQAPSWWPNRPESPRPIPLDVWGIVASLDRDGSLGSCAINDAGGRRVRIDGLSWVRGFDGVDIGDRVLFFDLESTELTRIHGVRIQPRNFHEWPTDGGLTLRRARRLQVYSGGEMSGVGP